MDGASLSETRRHIRFDPDGLRSVYSRVLCAFGQRVVFYLVSGGVSLNTLRQSRVYRRGFRGWRTAAAAVWMWEWVFRHVFNRRFYYIQYESTGHLAARYYD